MIVIRPYSDDQEETIRQFLGPAGSEGFILCNQCGNELTVEMNYHQTGVGVEIRVACTRCESRFVWNQWRLPGEWESLHEAYFIERFQHGEPIRCPYDDCWVSYLEHSDGRIEFRCPFCNRRGCVSLSSESRA